MHISPAPNPRCWDSGTRKPTITAPFAPQPAPMPRPEHFTAPEFAAFVGLIAAFTLALLALACWTVPK